MMTDRSTAATAKGGRLFKAFSLLLAYPRPEIREALPEIRAVVTADPRFDEEIRDGLVRLIDRLESAAPLDCEEEYVRLFERSRALSLDLFEHVHGDARDRGQAMVDLLALYRRHGFDIACGELPDHLPVFLEFLSTREEEAARDLLLQTSRILGALAERLEERGSDYAAVMRALVVLAGGRMEAPAQTLASRGDEDGEDLEALDRAWVEEPVTFGPGGGCPVVSAGRAAREMQSMLPADAPGAMRER